MAASEWPGEPAPVHPLTRLILFTTGSTGIPKAVQLSGGTSEPTPRAVIEAVVVRGRPRAQTLFLPLSYSYGLLGQLLPALEVGMRTDLVEAPGRPSRGIRSGVPPGHGQRRTVALRGDLAHAPAGPANCRVTHVVTAGAYRLPDLRRRLRNAFPHATIFNNYGQTEASPRILCLTSTHPQFFSPATGYPVGDLRVRLSRSGELLVSGSQVMLGYLGDAEGTRERCGTGGWPRATWPRSPTTDSSRSRDGCDELVNVGGERTSVLEIESALRRVRGVRNAGVLVVPDALYGAACVAYVEIGRRAVTEDEVLAPLRALRLAAQDAEGAARRPGAADRRRTGRWTRRALAAFHGDARPMTSPRPAPPSSVHRRRSSGGCGRRGAKMPRSRQPASENSTEAPPRLPNSRASQTTFAPGRRRTQHVVDQRRGSPGAG